MIRAFSNLVERTGDQDAAAAVWLIRVTNSTAVAVLFSCHRLDPPSFVPEGGDNLSQCDV